ncbi:AMP-binding protein [Aquisediminimonas profunda]|uniref:AMP-binding protein n=1 Tax=Aquisediminimonas profunda TaxID=1550733 RepID=UPI001C63806D|nr:AMP-binding protein [Aquisediminimonas profunda]
MNSNLYAHFKSAFAHDWQAPALVDAHGSGLSFGELDELSGRFAVALRGRGVGPGDRIVVQVEKSVGAVALYLACLRAGAIFVPLNTAYTPAEIEYFIKDAEPSLFVSAADMAGPDAPIWAEARAYDPDNAVVSRSADDIASIIYTSGTTGRSKGAMLSNGNLLSNARTLIDIWALKPDDVLIHALPIFHVHGLFVALHTMFLNRSKTIFLPKFDVSEVIGLMSQATILMGVPTFYTRLLADASFDKDAVRAMRLFISGSAPLLAETHRAFEARTGMHILERYGMTEAGMITSNPLEGDRIAGTVGMPLPGVELRVADAHGKPVTPGSPGVIEIRGPNVFKGYWRNPEKTAEDIRPDGWFITGDIATMDAEGRVTIVGRAKDLIISGGYNIYPKEIEEVIDAVPGVVESAVIGVPNADFGESVLAVIVGDASLEPSVRAAIDGNLARFKHPRRLIFVEDLPRNAMGKVQKASLRQNYSGG